MTAKKIDILNIGLIIISLIVAIKIPFELFLFSYAVLGPLHYLTEINWLHEKKYFISTKKKWSIVFIIITLLIAIEPLVRLSGIPLNDTFESVIKTIAAHNKVYLLTAFLFAVCLIFLNDFKKLAVALVLTILVSFVSVHYLPSVFVFMGVFLPTLIHVYIFTLFFILYGAIKAKSTYGYYLAALLFTVPFIISFISIDYLSYQPSEGTVEAFASSNIENVSRIVSRILNGFQNEDFLLLSEIGIRIQIFIAFAYTYHYLNWFSKTSIIGWKKAMTKRSAFLILVIWIASIALYLYDFRTGLIALFLLSFLHVLLEFPLNVITIKEVLFLKRKKSN